MSKKFTGITSAGSAIPVYDKDAHSALEQKLDTSAFSSVSGEFATVDDVVAAVSGKADTSAIPSLDGYATQEWVGEQGYLTEVPESAVSGFATHEEVESATSGAFPASAVNPLVNSIFTGIFANTVEYRSKPSANAIYAQQNTLANVDQIVGNSGMYIVPSGVLQVPNIITAATGGLTANGITAGVTGLTANGLSATTDPNYGGFSANGISAGPNGPLYIRSQYEIMSAGSAAGFTFSSQNTGFGTAQLTTAAPNSKVTIYSPKFEARNISGAGFSIEGSGARGYDASGNVTWDTTNPPPPNNLVGYVDTNASTGGLTGNIILSVVPKSYAGDMTVAPRTILNYNGLSATYGPTTSVPNISLAPNGITNIAPTGNSARAQFGLLADGAKFETSAGTWSLTGSVQKREIECDSATSAITAIAGSAIGGKEYSAGANIDITDEVISGKDWSEDIAGATSGLMQTSGLEYDGDKISGYMGSAFKAGTDLEFEYDSADNISAINSSAISTTPSQALYAKSPLYAGVSGTSSFIGVDETVLSDMVEQVASANYNETVLWSGEAHPNGLTAVGQLSEPISAFNEYEIHCSFESMYPYKVNKFSTPSVWTNQPNTNIKFGGIAEAVSWKPSENDNIMHAFISIGFGSNLTDLYVLSGTNIDCLKAAGSTATRNASYGAGLYYVTKVIGINRKEA